MLRGANHSIATAALPVFETVQVQFDWPQVFPTPVTRHAYSHCDLGREPENELAILLGGMADPYQRALQALRDVRHLLPPEGVAIVDAALR